MRSKVALLFNPSYRNTIIACTLIILLCILALIWGVLPLDTWFTRQDISALSLQFKGNALAPLYVVVLYMLGGLISFPVFILIPATAMVFGPFLGFLYSLFGLVANASLLYALGHLLGKGTIQLHAGNRAKEISRRLTRHGFVTVALLRLFPVAPFTIINLVSGASPITFGTYTIATVTGISPALIVMTFAGTELKNAFYNPVPKHLPLVLLAGIIVLIMATWLKRKVLKGTYR